MLLVYCFCDPIAFELCIAAPDPLPRPPPRSEWAAVVRNLVTSSASANGGLFRIPDENRPVDQTLEAETNVHELVTQWAQFYEIPICAACYVALDMKRRQDSGEQFVHALHIRRMYDHRSKTSIAFTFEVVSAAKVRNTELAQWIRRCRLPSRNEDNDDTLHFMMQRSREADAIPHHYVAQTFIYVTWGSSGDDSGAACYPFETHRWIPRHREMERADNVTEPYAYLKNIVGGGFYISPFSIGRNSQKKHNAWGFAAAA